MNENTTMEDPKLLSSWDPEISGSNGTTFHFPSCSNCFSQSPNIYRVLLKDEVMKPSGKLAPASALFKRVLMSNSKREYVPKNNRNSQFPHSTCRHCAVFNYIWVYMVCKTSFLYFFENMTVFPSFLFSRSFFSLLFLPRFLFKKVKIFPHTF